MTGQARQPARPKVILRNHPQLRDQWPTEPGGAFRPGYRSPEGGIDILEQVLYYAPVANAKANVALLTKYEGQQFTRDLLFDDPAFASRFVSWLRQHIGRTIHEIGELDIDLV